MNRIILLPFVILGIIVIVFNIGVRGITLCTYSPAFGSLSAKFKLGLFLSN
jgi:hypothetical protein